MLIVDANPCILESIRRNHGIKVNVRPISILYAVKYPNNLVAFVSVKARTILKVDLHSLKGNT